MILLPCLHRLQPSQPRKCMLACSLLNATCHYALRDHAVFSDLDGVNEGEDGEDDTEGVKRARQIKAMMEDSRGVIIISEFDAGSCSVLQQTGCPMVSARWCPCMHAPRHPIVLSQRADL